MREDESLWFEDGSVVVAIDNVMFKVHKCFLARLSPVFSTSVPSGSVHADGVPLITLVRGIANGKDVAALLRHIYHAQPLRDDAPFRQTARVLRAATQFCFADAREAALRRMREMYPPAPVPHVHARWEHLHEAAQVAIDCAAGDVLRGLLYGIVTTSEFDVDEHADDVAQPHPLPDDEDGEHGDTRGRSLSPSTTRLCTYLMHRIMDHFSPILFTVPTSAHMACTGVFADHWMAHAIQPAIAQGGVYRPLETLQGIQAVDWAALGLCDACCVEKRKEWADEAQEIWTRMDEWVAAGLQASSRGQPCST